MTHPYDITNGASLEDCHTNLFALADLSGMKWRCLSSEASYGLDPLDDPVLSSYSKCLAANLLCVWRRVKPHSEQQRPPLHDMNQLAYPKELWIFWYHAEPDLTNLVHQDLTESDEGCWENGISYECRTLLFKALHNLIERGLMSRGFTRLGKWFLQPLDGSDKNSSSVQFCFGFNFFVYGDSTVCTTVEIGQCTPVYKFGKHHMQLIQDTLSGLRVLLSPYSLNGIIHPQSTKENGRSQRLLQEWSNFYPIASGEFTENDEFLSSVDVISGGTKMRYPTSYVFVADPEESSPSKGAANNTPPFTFSNSQHCKTTGSSTLLTPPSSPCEPSQKSSFGDHFSNHSSLSYLRIKHKIWKDFITTLKETNTPDLVWNFCDASSRTSCICNRTKIKNQSVLKSENVPLNSSSLNSVPASSTSSTANKSEKDKFQRLKNSVAFHKRTSNLETASAVELDNYVASAPPLQNSSGATSIPTSSYQYKVPGTFRSTTPNGLPQLFGQPSLIGSPHPNTPLLEGPNSQISSSDPTMPTLSPHPPPHREEVEEGNRPITESLDQSAPSQSPITLLEVKTEPKSNEQIFSPYQSTHSSLLEPGPTKVPPVDCTSPPLTPSNEVQTVAPPPSNPIPPPPQQQQQQQQGVKRPILPIGTNDDPDHMLHSGLLYDYSSLQPLWEVPPSKRQHRMHKNWMDKENLGVDLFSKDSHFVENESLPLKPKDPYEFNDEFDEDSVSSTNFRNRVDVFIKEEEKPSLQTQLTEPSKDTSSIEPLSQASTQATAMPEEPTPVPPPNTDPTALGVMSPITPRNQGTSLTREEDLQVTDHDLEQLFDTSSDESADIMNYPPTGTPGSAKLGPTTPEEFANKASKLGPAELTRMFPTPPSLEHNTASPPLCTMGSTEVESSELYPGSPAEAIKDWSYVYRPPVQAKLIGSARYAPLPTLPSQALPPLPSLDFIYKGSWQVSNPPQPQPPPPPSLPPTSVPTHSQQQMLHHGPLDHHPLMDSHRNTGHMMMMDTDYTPQIPLGSSGVLDDHLHHPRAQNFDIHFKPPHHSSGYPEAHSLLVNLILSDSLLNTFKDHNFSSCVLCVCNMDIKGADAGLLLPPSLLPFEEPQERCTCGFSAVVNRHRSYRAGLFYEDEVEITGCPYEPFVRPKRNLATVENRTTNKNLNQGSLDSREQVPHHILDIIKSQCSNINSHCSVFSKANNLFFSDAPQPLQNVLEQSDGCEVASLALETGKQAIDNISNTRIDENLKSTCLHKWPYLPVKMPSNNAEIIHILQSLTPLLQECFKKRRTQGLWEVTYTVSGPLTWRQFHRLSEKGAEDQCEPQPIPTLLVGYEKEWMTVSPFACKNWDFLQMEPCDSSRDVGYVVVAPDNEFILSKVEHFFRELSSIYEINRLGRHCPLGASILNNGIFRVGATPIKVEDDNQPPLDDWFNSLGDGPLATKIRLYAHACRYQLAPHLANQQMDRTLFDGGSMKPPADKPPPSTPQPEDVKPPPPALETPAGGDSGNSGTPTPASNAGQDSQSTVAGAESSNEGSCNNTGCSGASGGATEEDQQEPPCIVVYLVEPFTLGAMDPDTYRLVVLGLLRCYAALEKALPEHIQSNLHLQVITLDAILGLNVSSSQIRYRDQLKTLAFNVYSTCKRTLAHKSTVKSLTGFGPAAAQEHFLHTRSDRNALALPQKITSFPYFLAPQKNKQTELGEMFGDRKEKSSVLFCSYCLSEDQRWLLGTCTNDRGDLMESITINIEIPQRTRRRKASARKLGLHKLFAYLTGVMSRSVQPWRVVLCRLGRLGHGELREWAGLLGRKSLLFYSNRLRDLCHQCSVSGPLDSPSILSACLVSLEPDTAIRIMHDQFTPDERFSSPSNSCDLSTPEDSSCTHILVFPTSATARPSKPNSQQEHIDALSTSLVDEDFFNDLNEEDITTVGQDINDLLGWTEGIVPSPGGRDSQPGSPAGGVGASGAREGGSEGADERLLLHQQPLALGYYVSTARTGPLPKWFWASCPHLENSCPVFLKCALLIHSPQVQQNSDELFHAPTPVRNNHPLDSNITSDVLRYVLEGFNALSWLSLDPTSSDRRSCLPINMQILMQLYYSLDLLV